MILNAGALLRCSVQGQLLGGGGGQASEKGEAQRSWGVIQSHQRLLLTPQGDLELM